MTRDCPSAIERITKKNGNEKWVILIKIKVDLYLAFGYSTLEACILH